MTIARNSLLILKKENKKLSFKLIFFSWYGSWIIFKFLIILNIKVVVVSVLFEVTVANPLPQSEDDYGDYDLSKVDRQGKVKNTVCRIKSIYFVISFIICPKNFSNLQCSTSHFPTVFITCFQ